MNLSPFRHALLDFVFPPKCPFCGGPLDPGQDGRPCSSCFSQIKFISSPRCPRCGRAFNSAVEQDHLCSECLTEERSFSQARSVCLYQGLIMETIFRFKYSGISRLAKPLGILLGEYQDPELPFSKFDLVLPVPLHPLRLRERGFNQSLLLARWVGRKHSLDLDFTSLQRSKDTQPQTQLSGRERQKNILGAFEVRRPERVEGKKILLVDDVFTTGATVQECSRVLLKAGAGRVSVLTLARAS